MRDARIVIADPSSAYRAGARRLLAREEDFDVVEVATFGELERATAEGDVAVALVDLELPPLGGLAAVAHLAECSAHSIVWSFEPTRDSVWRAIRAGASGYIRKQISPSLVRTLRGALHGEAPLSRDLATLLIDALHGLEQREQARERASVLSAREREVLALIASGARNREIAATLYISVFTVKRHVQNILEKLGLPSRRSAAALYLSLSEPSDPVRVREMA